MQTKELEELAGAQQNSLEEAEERYRDMQREQDELHHSALAAKAQLVTAQAQVYLQAEFYICWKCIEHHGKQALIQQSHEWGHMHLHEPDVVR